MAPDAVGGSTFELSSNVAGHAVERGVHSGQGETCVFQVIELHAKPVVKVVALIATGREAGRSVAWPGCPLKVPRVAGIALGR